MLEIIEYLSKYWSKYPQEQSCDPTFPMIKEYIDKGGKYFLKDNIFIIYATGINHAEIIHYWCDMKDMSLKTLKNTLNTHKQFIKSLNMPAYSIGIKDLFKRDYLVSFDNKTKSWRWL